jgi:hypothetical protein
MPEQVLLDNDVALKVACYSLVAEMIAGTTVEDTPPAMLGVGRFVIRGRLDRASNVANVARAKEALEQLLQAITLLEPDDEELAVAADLEAEASRRNLELDGGESQLLAILAKRACRLLITGDKRAIAAMAQVAPKLAASRIGCLEQLMALLMDTAGLAAVRPLVCGEPLVDRALTACFACSRDSVERDDVVEALSSYIGHVDRSAPDVLMRGFGSVVADPSG